MRVEEIMTRGAEVVDPNMVIRDAAQPMRADNIGTLPVGENDHLVGMATDRDIAMRAFAENKAPGTTSVREVMSKNVYCFYEDADVEEAASTMAQHQVHRLSVLNHDKRLVGIVALADLARGQRGHAAD